MKRHLNGYTLHVFCFAGEIPSPDTQLDYSQHHLMQPKNRASGEGECRIKVLSFSSAARGDVLIEPRTTLFQSVRSGIFLDNFENGTECVIVIHQEKEMQLPLSVKTV